MYLVLPFGITSAPYIFVKVTRPLIVKWRGEGKKVLMLKDDGFGCADNFDMCHKIALSIKNYLIKSGFLPKAKKSCWYLTQQIESLGVNLDSKNVYISIPQRRIDKCMNYLIQIQQSIKKHRRVHVKSIASFV